MKYGHRFGDHSQDGELARWGLERDTKWRSCYAQKGLRNAKQGNHLKRQKRGTRVNTSTELENEKKETIRRKETTDEQNGRKCC